MWFFLFMSAEAVSPSNSMSPVLACVGFLGPFLNSVLRSVASPLATRFSSVLITINAIVTKIQKMQYETTDPTVAEFCHPKMALKIPQPPFDLSSGLQQLTCL
jgi:hypothetical protein